MVTRAGAVAVPPRGLVPKFGSRTFGEDVNGAPGRPDSEFVKAVRGRVLAKRPAKTTYSRIVFGLGGVYADEDVRSQMEQLDDIESALVTIREGQVLEPFKDNRLLLHIQIIPIETQVGGCDVEGYQIRHTSENPADIV